MTDENMKILTNIIGAVESGGQVYGRRNYSAYAAPYTNSPLEHTITLGWAQNYGAEAYKLVSLIYARDPDAFDKIDPTGQIKEKINGEHDWVAEKWNPSTYQRYVLIALLDSKAGHDCQDELFEQLMQTYIADCESTYTRDASAVMMYCEIRHLGGKSAAVRIFDKCAGDYSLTHIMATLKEDQADKSSDNQVGDTRYWSRHLKCQEFITTYVEREKGGGKSVADLSFILTDFSKYSGMISNSGSDEHGKYSGGAAGDQTGKEWQIRTWYNRPWNYVLRYPDEKVRDCIATLAIEAANNDLIGYNQSERTTYWTHLKASGYRPANITIACEADCSAGVAANVKATGYLLGLPKLQEVSEDCYTGNLRAALNAAGFVTLSDKKYTTDTAYLLPGDILLYEGHHTATNLGRGRYANSTAPTSPTNTVGTTDTSTTEGGKYMFSVVQVYEGCPASNSVYLAQEILKARGLYRGALDKQFGPQMAAAVRAYQVARHLEVDAIIGPKTWRDMIAL